MPRRRKNPYKELMQYMPFAVIANGVLFFLYLVVAGKSIIWLKVIISILTITLSLLCLYVLHMSRELVKQRSLWMTVGAASVIICTLASLLLRFP